LFFSLFFTGYRLKMERHADYTLTSPCLFAFSLFFLFHRHISPEIARALLHTATPRLRHYAAIATDIECFADIAIMLIATTFDATFSDIRRFTPYWLQSPVAFSLL
jgi:hypothetical protein